MWSEIRDAAESGNDDDDDDGLLKAKSEGGGNEEERERNNTKLLNASKGGSSSLNTQNRESENPAEQEHTHRNKMEKMSHFFLLFSIVSPFFL